MLSNRPTTEFSHYRHMIPVCHRNYVRQLLYNRKRLCVMYLVIVECRRFKSRYLDHTHTYIYILYVACFYVNKTHLRARSTTSTQPHKPFRISRAPAAVSIGKLSRAHMVFNEPSHTTTHGQSSTYATLRCAAETLCVHDSIYSIYVTHGAPRDAHAPSRSPAAVVVDRLG